MSEQESDERKIPILKDEVMPVTQTTAAEELTNDHLSEQVTAAPQPASTLQEEIDAIIAQARADFDTSITRALSEMQQRIERELSELHIQLTSDD